jgi:hypothetical protein
MIVSVQSIKVSQFCVRPTKVQEVFEALVANCR